MARLARLSPGRRPGIQPKVGEDLADRCPLQDRRDDLQLPGAAADALKIDSQTEAAYEYGIDFYNNIAEQLNADGFDGGGWKAAEVQAIGWVAMQKMMGEEAEFVRDIIGKNTRRVSIGLAPGAGTRMSDRLAGKEIDPKVAQKVISDLAGLAGIKVLKNAEGAGAYLTYIEGAIQIDAMASPEGVRDFMDMVGYAFQQTEIISTRAMKSGKNSAIDILSPQLGTISDATRFFTEFLKVQPKDENGDPIAPGFQQVEVDGVPGIRLLNFGGLWGKRVMPQIQQAIENAASASGVDSDLIKVESFNVTLESTKNDWTEKHNGEAYLDSLADRGRVQEARELERRYSPSRFDLAGDGSIVWRVSDRLRSGGDDPAEAAGDAGVQLSRARQYEGQVAGTAPVFSDRAIQPGAAEFVGYHYSAVPRAQLSGTAYGSATSANRGKEYERVMQAKDRRIRDRVYFYTAPMADIPRSEPVVTGAHVHKVVLKNIFDPRNDDARVGLGASEFESSLIDAGYDGYVNHEAGMIVVLNTRPIPVQHIGNRQGLREQIKPNPVLTGAVKIEYPSRSFIARDGMVTKKPDAGQWVGGKDEAAVRAAAPSFKVEYGEMKVAPEEKDAANEALRTSGNSFQFSRQVWDNPRFRAWFGDSTIRKDDGSPKVMYHGTARDIQAFRAKQAGAIFVTDSPSFANRFAEASEEWMAENAEEFLDARQMSMAIDRAVNAARKSQVFRTMSPMDQADFIADIKSGKPRIPAGSVILGREVKAYLPSGQNILPLYVRAERPFDYENDSQVETIALAVWKSLPGDFGDGRPMLTGRKENRQVTYEDLVDTIGMGSWSYIEAPAVQQAIRARHDSFYVTEGGEKNLAVYSPTQLKSAIGNNGEYDPSVPDIRYSRPVSAQGSQFTLPKRSIKERAANLLTNEMSRMKDIREDVGRQGGSLSDDNDVDMQNRLSIRMAGTKVDRFRNTVVKPLVKRAENLGKDSGARGDVLGDSSLLLYAMHAPERNKYIAGINPRFPDGGSGMTNKEAKDAIDALKQKYGPANFVRLSAIANDFQAITQRTQNTLVSGDLVDPTLAQSWNGRYSSYVPLKGFEKVDDSAKETSNIDPRWDFSRRALGRESRAGQIIENILKDHERAILMVAKNDVRKSFLQFVRDNPDDKLWKVNRVVITQQFRKTLGLQSPVGQAQEIVSRVAAINKDKKKTVAVRVGGQLFYISVDDEALLNDLNEELSAGTPEDAKAIFRLWKSINKNLGFVWTALSPVFVLTNFIRDLSYGTIKTARDFGVAAGAKVLGNSIRAVPSIWRAVYTNNWTGGSSEYERWFNEFREQGGAMGLVSQLSVDEQHERLMDSFRAYEGALKDDWKTWGRPALKYVTAIKDFVVNANSGIEQAVRVAAYAEARKRKEPPKKAADIAANVTVDFARRGKLGPLLGSLYLFYNPAVQGTANLMEVVKGKRGAAVVGSLIGG